MSEHLTGIPPEVAGLFEEYALRLFRTGFERYSARAILHRIRWHFHVDKGDRGFKCNNNWTPKLARWAMSKHPQLYNFFELRASPQRHSMADYAGPYTSERPHA